MRKLGIAVLAVGAILTTLAVSGAARADHSWSTYHWARTSNPFTLRVIDSVTNFWQFEFETALSEWGSATQQSPIRLTKASSDDTSRTRRQCRASAGQIRVCNDAYGLNGWLGLATIGIDSRGHIDRGTAKMNDSYSSYWADPNEQRHVMCQEIGHLFGLGHTSEDGSSQNTCMDYSRSPTSISPNAHDYEQLRTIYQHLDTYNSYTTSSAGSATPKTVPAELPPGVPLGALLVHTSQFEDVYVMGRPDGGGWWIFHVRIAPEGAR